MDQTVEAPDVDERAELGERAYNAFTDVTFRQMPERFFSSFRRGLFQHNAPVHHHVFLLGVELGDAALNFLADQLLHLRNVFGAATGGGHERTDADVHA